MNTRKEDFIKLLAEKTNHDEIKWFAGSGSQLYSICENSKDIMRTFSSEYNNCKIYYVEQKYLTYNSDLEEYEEHIRKDVYIVAGGIARTKILQENVTDSAMEQLENAIINKDENNVLDSIMDEMKNDK